ncbi:MAG TPA: hypothetical protein VI356_06260 [Myxococcales bacterium]
MTLKTDEGWSVGFDGFVNGFAGYERGSETPANMVADPLLTKDGANSFRMRTGLLPGLFGFTVAAPTTEGLDVKARVGFYPQIQNNNTRNAFGAQIDLREVFFTVDSKYGQVLLGRALNLYQGRNILTDMTLFGLGAPGPVGSGGTTLGRIGYGYLYANFGAQLRYTTPAFSGVKLAVAVVDPSQISGGGVAATQTNSPGFEAEVSWSTKMEGGTKLEAWASGLYQRASIPGGARKLAEGAAGGLSAGFGPVELLVSGFGGKGLGSFLLLDTDALDSAGEERSGFGVLAQASYMILASTKVGVSYGQNTMNETAAELAARQAGAPSTLSTRRSFTGGIYHDFNKNLKAVLEFTHAVGEWYSGPSQSVDVVGVGGFFLW